MAPPVATYQHVIRPEVPSAGGRQVVAVDLAFLAVVVGPHAGRFLGAQRDCQPFGPRKRFPQPAPLARFASGLLHC